MNLYNLHTDPEQLDEYKNKLNIPSVAWAAYKEINGPVPVDYENKILDTLMKSPNYAYKVAISYPPERWPEAEKYIITDPGTAANYAREFQDDMGGRWKEAEPLIMKHPVQAVMYARYVIGDRWPEAAEYIKQNQNAWSTYKKINRNRERNKF